MTIKIDTTQEGLYRECEDCNGSGVQPYSPWIGGNGKWQFSTTSCNTCGGEGVILNMQATELLDFLRLALQKEWIEMDLCNALKVAGYKKAGPGDL